MIKLVDNEIILKNGKRLKHFKIIPEILESAGIYGVTTGIIRERLKLLDKFEAPKDEIEITEKELQIIISAELNFAWGFMERSILEFEDYLKRF